MPRKIAKKAAAKKMAQKKRAKKSTAKKMAQKKRAKRTTAKKKRPAKSAAMTKSYGRTTAGVELTAPVLDRMAREAEEGLDVAMLRRRPGRPAMGSGPAESFPVRLDPELREALDDRAAADDTTASDVVRDALRRYLKVS